MRFRVTVRDASIELRGYVDGEDVLRTLADDMNPTLVIASVADPAYNPFEIDQPEHPPTPQASMDIIRSMWETFDNVEEFLSQVSMLHFAQANVIRGERGARINAEKELLSRELHHCETEQINERLEAELAAAEEELRIRREDRGA